jgi:hypothetical protein
MQTRFGDYLVWVVGANLVASVVAVVTAIAIAFHSTASRNIALGTGAVTGAIIAFALQLWFDLQRSTRFNQISLHTRSISLMGVFVNGTIRR